MLLMIGYCSLAEGSQDAQELGEGKPTAELQNFFRDIDSSYRILGNSNNSAERSTRSERIVGSDCSSMNIHRIESLFTADTNEIGDYVIQVQEILVDSLCFFNMIIVSQLPDELTYGEKTRATIFIPTDRDSFPLQLDTLVRKSGNDVIDLDASANLLTVVALDVRALINMQNGRFNIIFSSLDLSQFSAAASGRIIFNFEGVKNESLSFYTPGSDDLSIPRVRHETNFIEDKNLINSVTNILGNGLESPINILLRYNTSNREGFARVSSDLLEPINDDQEEYSFGFKNPSTDGIAEILSDADGFDDIDDILQEAQDFIEQIDFNEDHERFDPDRITL